MTAANYWCRFPGDYLRDTRHLSLVEHGAYTLLLDAYYTSGPLPANAVALYRICGCQTDEERKAVDSIADEFFPVNGDGRRHNGRCDRELAFQAENSDKKRDAANRRWSRSAEAQHEQTSCTSNADAMQVHSTSNAPHPHPHPHTVPPTPETLSPSETVPKGVQGDETAVAQRKAPRRAFVKPSLQQVTDYCRERRNQVNPQQWLDHYEANGWRVGKNPMSDWRAAVRTWEANGINKAPPGEEPFDAKAAARRMEARIAAKEAERRAAQ